MITVPEINNDIFWIVCVLLNRCSIHLMGLIGWIMNNHSGLENYSVHVIDLNVKIRMGLCRHIVLFVLCLR